LGDTSAQDGLGRGGEAGDERRAGEDHEPRCHHAAWTHQVSGPTADQHQPAEGERVGAHDPGEAVATEPQVGAHLRQRDRDHGHVEDEHELCGTEKAEQPPAVRVLRRGRGRRDLV
jgi:hypothetical protein